MILYVVFWLNKNPYVMYTSYVMFRISRERLTFYFTNTKVGISTRKKEGVQGGPFYPMTCRHLAQIRAKAQVLVYSVCVH